MLFNAAVSLLFLWPEPAAFVHQSSLGLLSRCSLTAPPTTFCHNLTAHESSSVYPGKNLCILGLLSEGPFLMAQENQTLMQVWRRLAPLPEGLSCSDGKSHPWKVPSLGWGCGVHPGLATPGSNLWDEQGLWPFCPDSWTRLWSVSVFHSVQFQSSTVAEFAIFVAMTRILRNKTARMRHSAGIRLSQFYGWKQVG